MGPQRDAEATGNADDPVIDLRVDDSRDPAGDLHRLLDTSRAHRLDPRVERSAGQEAVGMRNVRR
ncbi:hypothetical protein [Saccharothrix deserti]|uniref:hypothetical protein n=1 Tax=Saccharothrix deserti TaxID=2593674 RepID=UPI00131E5232|nr:hypothetical protein [Saccharothrix deserti]